jgi:hypothetical protein
VPSTQSSSNRDSGPLGSRICCDRRDPRKWQHGKGQLGASVRLGLTPDAWRIIGYVRDVVIILGVMFGAMYFYEHPEKFDAFMNWLIGYRYRQ